MKLKYLTLVLVVATLFSCKNKSNPSENEGSSMAKDSTDILHKIAKANGLDHWKDVNEIDFTFNAKLGDKTMKRSWKWQPKKDEVMMMNQQDTMQYARSSKSKMDSLQINTDKAFINDKYWLLFPFQLVWDDGFKTTMNKNATAPISGKKMKEITVAYNDKDGYTPGDMYKIYVDNDNMIREWEYHPDGSKEPKMTTTWEDYETMNGLKIATMHTNKDKSVKLYFTDVQVK